MSDSLLVPLVTQQAHIWQQLQAAQTDGLNTTKDFLWLVTNTGKILAKLDVNGNWIGPIQDKAGQVFNVMAYGATGLGVADDTSAIQLAIDAMPNSGILFFPAGIYKFSNIDTRNKSIIFQGVGWGVSAGALPGDASWSNYAAMTGTILVSTATSGSAISIPLNFSLQSAIRDLALIGHNTASVTGINLSWRAELDNVLIANFVTGLSLTSIYELEHGRIWIRGCGTGLLLNGANNHVFRHLMITWCTVNAISMIFAWGNEFDSPLIENNTCSTMINLTDDGNSAHGSNCNIFRNVWMENGSAPTGYSAITIGVNCIRNRYGPSIDPYSEVVTVNGPGNEIGPMLIVAPNGTGGIVVASTATDTILHDPVGPVTGAGAALVTHASRTIANTSGTPADAPAANTIRFDPATFKLWIYTGSAWKSTTLS